MNSFDKNKKYIISKLNNLPNIKDERTKQEEWEGIKRHNATEKRTKAKQSLHLFPALAIIVAVAILAIMIPQFIDDEFTNKTTDHSDSFNNEMNGSQSGNSAENFDTNYDNNDSYSTQKIEDDFGRKVIHSIHEDEQIVYAVVPGSKAQYMIPVSFIVPASAELEKYYNDLDNYLPTDKWGTGEYAIQHNITMDIDTASNQLTMNIPSDFNIGSGAQANMFQQTLTYMFHPLGINEVQFDTADNTGVDLGPIGMMKELEIDSIPKAGYKLYQETSDEKSFLVPVPSTDGNMSIEEAIEMMKEDQDDYHIQKSIPESVDFRISGNDSELVITFTEIGRASCRERV